MLQLLQQVMAIFHLLLMFIIYKGIYLLTFESVNQMAKKAAMDVNTPEANKSIILYLRSLVPDIGFFLFM